MIFISDDFRRSSVFSASHDHTTAGDVMKKSGILIASALLTLGLAAGAMASGASNAVAMKSADAPAAAASTDAAKPAKATKPAKKPKKSSTKKKAAAPATTK
jgi:hypothetical protein